MLRTSVGCRNRLLDLSVQHTIWQTTKNRMICIVGSQTANPTLARLRWILKTLTSHGLVTNLVCDLSVIVHDSGSLGETCHKGKEIQI
jgi:hypothetical protein